MSLPRLPASWTLDVTGQYCELVVIRKRLILCNLDLSKDFCADVDSPDRCMPS